MLMDRPDGAALRQSVRSAHKAYLAQVGDRIAFAGPLTRDDGVTMIGSLLAIDFDSRDAAHAWLAGEPFTRAGLYASVAVHVFANLWPQKAGFPAAAIGAGGDVQVREGAAPPAGSTAAGHHHDDPGDNGHVQTLR